MSKHRRTYLALVVVCAARLLAAHANAAAPSLHAAATAIPERRTLVSGTDVTGVVPAGMKMAPLGSILTNEDDTIIIILVEGRVHSEDAARDAKLDDALFPEPKESIHGEGIDGTLYHRTRAKNGGAWDGWQVDAVDGARRLTVTAYYTGSAEGEFEKLKTFMLGLRWTHQPLDPETAFGAAVELRGATVSREEIAGLRYAQRGDDGRDSTTLELTAFPIPRSQAGRATQAECAKIIDTHFRTSRFPGAQPLAIHRGIACDGWNIDSHGHLDYMFAMVRADGIVLTASGHGDPPAQSVDIQVGRFRAAMVGMRMLRANGK